MAGVIPPGSDWAIDRIVKVTDGDSIRVFRSQVIGELDGIEILARDTNPKGAAIRLITVDTPEHGQPGWEQAREDVSSWLRYAALGARLRIETWPGGGFDRLLGDVYVDGDRSDTLSQWLLRHGNNGQGWLPYVKGQ